MISRRLSANLKAQNWIAIGIEFVIVVVRAYLGILAANWNLVGQRTGNKQVAPQADAAMVHWSLNPSIELLHQYYTAHVAILR